MAAVTAARSVRDHRQREVLGLRAELARRMQQREVRRWVAGRKAQPASCAARPPCACIAYSGPGARPAWTCAARQGAHARCSEQAPMLLTGVRWGGGWAAPQENDAKLRGMEQANAAAREARAHLEACRAQVSLWGASGEPLAGRSGAATLRPWAVLGRGRSAQLVAGSARRAVALRRRCVSARRWRRRRRHTSGPRLRSRTPRSTSCEPAMARACVLGFGA
jgi:hypothetical protein